MNKEMYVGRLKEQQNDLLGLLSNIDDQIDNFNFGLADKAKLYQGEETLIQAPGIPAVKGKGITPCQIWDIIKGLLVGFPLFFTDGILNELYELLEDIIEDDDITNCKLKEQLENALEILDELIDTVETLNCVGKCEELVGKLFCIVVELILEMVEIIAKIIILLIFCNNCGMECSSKGKVTYNFCKCLTHELAEELCDFEELIEKLNDLAMDFIECTPGKDHKYCDKKHHHQHQCGCQSEREDYYCAKGWKGQYERPSHGGKHCR